MAPALTPRSAEIAELRLAVDSNQRRMLAVLTPRSAEIAEIRFAMIESNGRLQAAERAIREQADRIAQLQQDNARLREAHEALREQVYCMSHVAHNHSPGLSDGDRPDSRGDFGERSQQQAT